MIRMATALVIGFLVALGINAAIRADVHETVSYTAQGVPSAMAGPWTGDAQIFVNWTAQRTLPVRLAIAPDGTVTGTVGDAVLRNARFASNRNSIERALHMKTDWIVKGDLDGDVIKTEGIHRGSVMVPLDWVDGHFEGGVNTSGTHFGGKQSMWLAAGHMRLERGRQG